MRDVPIRSPLHRPPAPVGGDENARNWARTMSAHPLPGGLAVAHPDPAGVVVAAAVATRRAGGGGAQLAGRRRHPVVGGRAPTGRGGSRSVAHLLRARPRPHPARHRLPPPGRQDPGLRVPGRPPAHPADPRARGGPGGQRASPGRCASTSRSPRRSPSATTAGTAPAATPARTRCRPYPARRLRPRRVGRRRGAGPAQPVRRDARRHPQPLVVAPGAGHPRGRGGRLGRPHRLRLPRLRGRGVRRRRRARRPPRPVRRAVRSSPQPADRRLRRRRGRGHDRGRAAWP